MLNPPQQASKKRRQRRRHHHVHQVMKNEPQLATANDPIETCVNAILTMPETFKIADISVGGEDYTAKTPGHLVQNFTLKLTPKECYQAVDGAGVPLGGNSVDAVVLRQYTLEVKVISDLHLQEVNRVLVIGGLLVLVGLPNQLMRNSAAGSAAFSWLGERLGFKLIDVGSPLER
ncbi:hypothetical protein O0L34_g11912 [Tuta absoluta]|nr:hypothetical protein O0L34_g11912 [Tuta absoluta]